MNVKIYKELNRPNSKGEALIILRCRVDSKKISFSTGIRISEKDWNKPKSQVRQSNENATNYNHLIKKYENEIMEIASTAELVNHELTKDYISQRLSFTSDEVKSQAIEEHYKEFKQIKSVQVTPSTIKKFDRMFESLKVVCEIMNCPFTYISFNDLFFSKLLDYYYREKELTSTSAKDYQKKLSAFLNWCSELGYNSNDRYKKFKVKNEEPDIFPLNEAEILRLELQKFPLFDIKDKSRDIFLFLTYTGMRFSEAMIVKPSHINQSVIRFQSKKVKGAKYLIPLTKKALAIIEKYKNQTQLTDGHLLPRLENQVVNRYLKQVGKITKLEREIVITRTTGLERKEEKMKLYEQLSCHDGRRTFITFCLSKGMNAQMIMKITGHANYSTFERYVNFDDNDLTKALKFVWE